MRELPPEVDELDRALNKIVDQRLGKSVDDVYDELDDKTEAQAVRMRHVQEELDELREAFAELFAAHEDHEERADGMAEDLWSTMQQKRPMEKSRQAPRAPSTTHGCETLAKAMLPGQAPVVQQAAARQLAEWFGKSGGQAVPYDGNIASHLVLTGQATKDQMHRWKQWHRLPDGMPLSKAVPQKVAVAEEYRFKQNQPARHVLPYREDAPKVDGAALRKALDALLTDGHDYGYDASMASQLVMQGALRPEEATLWRRTGHLRLDLGKSLSDPYEVNVERPTGPPVAAMLLSDAALGKRMGWKAGHGHRSPQRQAAVLADALVRLTQMAR